MHSSTLFARVIAACTRGKDKSWPSRASRHRRRASINISLSNSLSANAFLMSCLVLGMVIHFAEDFRCSGKEYLVHAVSVGDTRQLIPAWIRAICAKQMRYMSASISAAELRFVNKSKRELRFFRHD